MAEDRDATINDEEQVFFARRFNEFGDLTLIRDLQRDLQINYNAAARRYVNSEKTPADKSIYMRERSDKCGKAYEDRLLALGLITRTLTASERLNFEMISWLSECAITTERLVSDEGESCGAILAQVRQYLFYVATVLGTEKMRAAGDLAPLGFSSVAHKEAYDAALVPYVYVSERFTTQEIEDYEADKNNAF